ncbi:relaxase/mobilization nuclease domain-containing protein [Sphingopyxis sp. MC1]|uniref:relaxase/mobilization nuclease domain-containing protein n=1 Tax=Sphingopyxis sp. MC1 TaxID=1174684 RepID=UPI00058C7919|nr:relaxase/mobilization nuclease domain-containing protein [Sphingopyxis sp. MC1]
MKAESYVSTSFGIRLSMEANEEVCVLEISGMATDDLTQALIEMQEITDRGQRGVKGLYHSIISPQPGYQLTEEQWLYAADVLAKQLKLHDQPRAIVLHEKADGQGGTRTHAHIVFQRTDREKLILIPDSWNYPAHERAARHLEQKFGHEIVPGKHAEPKQLDQTFNEKAETARRDSPLDQIPPREMQAIREKAKKAFEAAGPGASLERYGQAFGERMRASASLARRVATALGDKYRAIASRFSERWRELRKPLIMNRYAGRGSMDDLCRETLALTKMDWNNDGPYDRMPVTLSFAGSLASVVKQMPKLEPRSYPVRLFM